MRVLGVALVLLLAGCDQLFKIDAVSPAGSGDARPADGPADGAPDAYVCIQPTLSDDFSGSMSPCGSWGNVFPPGATGLSRTNGQLQLTPPATTVQAMTAAVVGCASSGTIPFDRGVFGHVTAVFPVSTNGYTNLTVTALGGSGGLQIAASHGVLAVYEPPNYGTMLNSPQPAFDPQTEAWWRIHPGLGGTIVAETSPDGTDWKLLYALVPTAPVPSSVQVSLAAGDSFVGDPSPGTAAFDSFDICPP